MIIVMSYPRSASLWSLVIARNLIDEEIYKSHDGNVYFKLGEDIPFDAQHTKIIMTVRNYKECIVRHETHEQWETSLDHYMSLIQIYENNNRTKHIIFYEDLMIRPAQTIQNLGISYSIDQKLIDKFCQNIESHKKVTLAAKPSITAGDPTKVNFHSKQLTMEQRKLWDSYLRTEYKKLYAKYLTRYEEI